MKKVLFLTGCVNPNGMAFTILNDVEERKHQYVNAIQWYLSNTDFDIVFAENTNADLSLFFKSCENHHRLECLTFNGNDYDKRLGKGYGEAKILEYALANSLKLKDADLIVKITGRLIIMNVNVLLKECDKAGSLYVKGSSSKNKLYQSFFFAAPPSFYQLFCQNAGRLNDSIGYYFEHLMYDMGVEWKKRGGKIKEFFHPIKTNGVSGSTGKKYPSGIVYNIKSYIRYFLNNFLGEK